VLGIRDSVPIVQAKCQRPKSYSNPQFRSPNTEHHTFLSLYSLGV
jgi:hypothetical protein